ncbi:MAG: hypothetical protein ACO3E0_00710 [Candidatus Kapaibacteriota bacterium]
MRHARELLDEVGRGLNQCSALGQRNVLTKVRRIHLRQVDGRCREDSRADEEEEEKLHNQ